jgi:hypothetical protein
VNPGPGAGSPEHSGFRSAAPTTTLITHPFAGNSQKAFVPPAAAGLAFFFLGRTLEERDTEKRCKGESRWLAGPLVTFTTYRPPLKRSGPTVYSRASALGLGPRAKNHALPILRFRKRGRCGEGGAPLKTRCSSCGFENTPTIKFCGECGKPLAQAAKPGPSPDPRSYTPKHLAEKILTSRSALEGERKQVTVLFADVKGSMDLAEQVDPEEWHRIMTPVLLTALTRSGCEVALFNEPPSG